MKKISILWVDDEIDLLRPHILFLQQKGYELETANNGYDAIEMVKKKEYDIFFIDENMPGLNGIETLKVIKEIQPLVPVIMITKSEEENIMDDAIGSKINDYLIKPVNPNQILLSIKKNIDHRRLIAQKTNSEYQMAFSKLGMEINDSLTHQDWINVYKKLVYWELELSQSAESAMDEVLQMQKNEANSAFTKYIKKNYASWFGSSSGNKPILSPSLLKEKVFPQVLSGKKTFLLVIDNLRFDQWKVIQPELNEFYKTETEDMYYSILPTSTQYARNSLFSGLMPSEIDRLYPELWKNDEEEGGKNLYEEDMLKKLVRKYNISDNLFFEKINDIKNLRKVNERVREIVDTSHFMVMIVNFVDYFSHAVTDQKMIKELVGNETAYRSITQSWFKHSPLLELLRSLSELGVNLVITTDHGTIKVQNAIKVIGERNTTTNLRYKQGRNLNYNPKEVFEVLKPESIYLPRTNLNSSYIFATGNDFFAYHNNFNHFVKYYRDSFQHGGVSLEEMLIPVIHLSPRK
ncbi:MAG TPA: bifunctional response regulator/alkaline phosphatase family protein [Bacteroidales bacterium]|nr:bifunctional response regulator/alkaline phosphatase family protein [Bacteroidales bacterium]